MGVKGVTGPLGLEVRAKCIAKLLALTPNEVITPLTPKKLNK